MLTEQLVIVDARSFLWDALRPLVDVALQLERFDDAYRWHGWEKQQINTFLKELPPHCTLLAGVWESSTGGSDTEGQERLVLGSICEVLNGEICSVCTFEALADLPPVRELEPGFEHALEIMRAAKNQIAPVAWALFTDKATWDEWLFASPGAMEGKGEQLAALARQGRCVLMGSQTAHHHP